MDYAGPVILIGFVVILVGAFYMGRLTTQWPSEEEMMARLVRAELKRKTEAKLRSRVFDEVDKRAASHT